MDKKALITKLHDTFCELSKEGKVYSKVWLEDADFGGLYSSGKYILNIKAHHEIDQCSDEIDFVVDALYEKAREELLFIYRVKVHHGDDEEVCNSSNVVFEESNICPS